MRGYSGPSLHINHMSPFFLAPHHVMTLCFLATDLWTRSTGHIFSVQSATSSSCKTAYSLLGGMSLLQYPTVDNTKYFNYFTIMYLSLPQYLDESAIAVQVCTIRIKIPPRPSSIVCHSIVLRVRVSTNMKRYWSNLKLRLS